MNETKTNLYRHFDSNGDLLYVGISLSAVARLQKHTKTACWFQDIARVEIETFPSREAALAAEKAAIVDEHPRFNIIGARPLYLQHAVFRPVSQAVAANDRLLEPIFTREGAARARRRSPVQRVVDCEVDLMRDPTFDVSVLARVLGARFSWLLTEVMGGRVRTVERPTETGIELRVPVDEALSLALRIESEGIYEYHPRRAAGIGH